MGLLQIAEVAPEPESKAPTGKAVICRLCKGGHYTAKCPFKDSLAAIDNVDGDDGGDAPPADGMGGILTRGGSGVAGKYVPP